MIDVAIGALLLAVTLAEFAYDRYTRRPAAIERRLTRDLKAGDIAGPSYRVLMERLAHQRVRGRRRGAAAAGPSSSARRMAR